MGLVDQQLPSPTLVLIGYLISPLFSSPNPMRLPWLYHRCNLPINKEEAKLEMCLQTFNCLLTTLQDKSIHCQNREKFKPTKTYIGHVVVAGKQHWRMINMF